MANNIFTENNSQ